MDNTKNIIMGNTPPLKTINVDKKLNEKDAESIIENVDAQLRQLSEDKISELIKDGMLNFDNVCQDALDVLGTGNDSTFYQGEWQNWQNVARQVNTRNGIALDAINPAGNNFAITNKMTNLMIPNYLGYGVLSQLEASPWVNKVLDFKADNLFGKGIALRGDGSSEVNKKIQNLNIAMDDYNINEEMLTLMRWTYLYGGADIAVGIKGIRPYTQQRPIEFNDMYIPKGSVMQFQAVCPYLSSPMILNNINAFAPFFYQVEHRMVINQLTHVNRLITMHTARPNQVLAPQYQYRGISFIQTIIKYLFQIITASNATAQAMIQNSLWVYEASANLLSDTKFKAQLQQLQAKRDNTMFIPIQQNDKIYVVQIKLDANAEIIRTWLDLVSVLCNAPQTMFVGSAAKGLNATGTQEMKNFHDTIDSARIKTMYNQAWRKAINYLQCSVNGGLDPRIKIQNVELDESYNLQRLQMSLLDAQVAESYQMQGLITPDQAITHIAQSEWNVYNHQMQQQVDGLENLIEEPIGENQYVSPSQLNVISEKNNNNITNNIN